MRLWVHAIWDLATSAPTEIVRELQQDLRYALLVYRSRSLGAALAVLALGFAIAASTAAFSVLSPHFHFELHLRIFGGSSASIFMGV